MKPWVIAVLAALCCGSLSAMVYAAYVGLDGVRRFGVLFGQGCGLLLFHRPKEPRHDSLVACAQATAEQRAKSEELDRLFAEQRKAHAQRKARAQAEFDALPAFGTVTTCGKCGGEKTWLRYESSEMWLAPLSGGHRFSRLEYPSMVRKCAVCAYEWSEKPKDAEVTQ